MKRALIRVLLFVALAPAASTQDFFSLPMVLSPATPVNTVADFDGDGDTDLLLGFAQTFRVWSNDGQGRITSTSSTMFIQSADYRQFAALDYDQDGLCDVAAGRFAASVTGFDLVRNLGGGSFAPSALVSVPGFTRAIRTGRANNDAFPDLLVIHEVGLTLVARWYVNTTSGAFVAGPSVPFFQVDNVVMVDADGDGDDDLVTYDFPTNNIVFHITNGGIITPGATVPLLAPFTVSSNGSVANLLIRGDYDADGDVDVGVILNGAANAQVSLVRNDGAGNWTALPRQTLPSVGGSNVWSFTGDWDGDGFDDLFQHSDFVIGVYRNLGNMTFTRLGIAPKTPSSSLSRGVAGIDLDNDGCDDIVTEHEVVMSNNDPDRFSQGWQGDVMVDWEADGDLDNVVSGMVNLNDGRGNLSAQPLPAAFIPPTNTFLEHQIDMDADGDLDFITSSFTFNPFPSPPTFLGHNLLVNDENLQGINNGQLTPGPLDQILSPILVDDINRDGLQDILSPGTIWINLGNLTLFPITVPAGFIPKDVSDVDGDGDTDILMLLDTQVADTVAILFNTGLPNFSFVVIHTQGNVSDVHWGDPDGDGDIDTMIYALDPNGSPAGFEIVIYENRGAMTPGLHSVPAGLGGGLVGTNDVDGDGFVDLICGARFQSASVNAVLVFPGTSTPFVFGPAQIYWYLNFTGLADIDADGDMDLLGGTIALNRRFRGSQVGSRQEYGVGTPGSRGIVPTLGATGPFRAGETISVVSSYATGGAPGLLVIGSGRVDFVDTPFPGLNTYVEQPTGFLPFTAFGPLDVAGEGFAVFLAVVPPSLIGTSITLHVAYADAGSASGFSSTNALELSFD